MQYCLKLVDVDEDEDLDMVVVVEEIPDTMVLMVIIHQILIKGKSHYTTKSGIILRQNNCYRCGIKGHWSHTCRTPKHLVDLYQASIKAKAKEIEMNFIDGNGLDLIYYDIDFFGGLSE